MTYFIFVNSLESIANEEDKNLRKLLYRKLDYKYKYKLDLNLDNLKARRKAIKKDY